MRGWCAAVLFASTVALGHQAAAQAQSGILREPAMIPPQPLVSTGNAISSTWIQLYLPENQYNETRVSDASAYRVFSTDDSAFRNGVQPVRVHHRYWPENAWYAAQTNGTTDIAEINVVYHAFLQLPVPLHEGKSYSVVVDPAVISGGPFDFAYGRSSVTDGIHVNQVGYRAEDAKVAYFSWWTGEGTVALATRTFEIVDDASNAVVFTGTMHLDVDAAHEIWSHSSVYSIDFSGLRTTGRYHVHIPTVGNSIAFVVSRTVYDDVAYTLIRGLTLQRDDPHGLGASVTHWTRPPAHIDDAVDEHTGHHVDLTGGHMDAGDRGKYPWDSADFAASILSAAILYPAEVEALRESLQIPESHNGVPDLLDEAMYELDWLAKAVLNSQREGALPNYLRPSSGGYEEYAPPQGLTGRVLFDDSQGPNRAETLYAAGALAMAANTPLMQKYVPAKCALYRAAALRAFRAFEAHNAQPSWFKDVPGYDTYAKPHMWSDEMLVAAANLFKLTGDAKYLTWIRSEMPASFADTRIWTWKVEGPYIIAFLSMLQITDPRLDPAIKRFARADIVDDGNATTTHDGGVYDAPFGAPLPWMVNQVVGWYYTGSNNAFPLMIAYGVTGDRRFRDQLVRDWNWELGTNPLNRSFISGLGDPERRPRWMVHEIAQVEWARFRNGHGGWSEIVPGVPDADIQNGYYDYFMSDPHNAVRVNKKFPLQDQSYPALYRYHDSWTVTDEITINLRARGAVSVLPLVNQP